MICAVSLSELAGEVWVCQTVVGGDCRETPAEGSVEDLVHALRCHEVQLLPDVGRDLFQVLLIALGNDDSF